ncbi:MAG TPA: BBP7 family outer membrane beta-barrel protein, partial [Gemmata sp.]|nr:BBP7 family outer membrane beta-barrel protein [Gemmata sp.]
MHRIFSGGLALVLGVAAAPVAGQDNRPETSPQKRIARLGQPVAVHDGAAPADQEVTTAGLLRRRVMTTVGSPPADSPLVPSVAPLNPSTIPSFGPVPGNIGPTRFASTDVSPSSPPGPTANSPTVTEDRAKNTVPVAPGYPNYVPSVVPDGGMVFQQSPIDAPVYGDGLPVGSPVERLANCGRWRISGEYLMWWSRAADLPALVTTSSLPFNGQIGNGDTQVLVGNGGFGETFHSGLRLSGVRWFGNSECRGLDGRIFFLGQAASSFTATGGQYPLLARPFINPNPGTPFYGSDSEIVSAMGFLNGGVTVQLENTIWGAEANYRRYLWSTPFFRVDGLVGYRFLNYNEKLEITENFIRPPFSNLTGGVPAVMGTVVDQFRTEN